MISTKDVLVPRQWSLPSARSWLTVKEVEAAVGNSAASAGLFFFFSFFFYPASPCTEPGSEGGTAACVEQRRVEQHCCCCRCSDAAAAFPPENHIQTPNVVFLKYRRRCRLVSHRSLNYSINRALAALRGWTAAHAFSGRWGIQLFKNLVMKYSL